MKVSLVVLSSFLSCCVVPVVIGSTSLPLVVRTATSEEHSSAEKKNNCNASRTRNNATTATTTCPSSSSSSSSSSSGGGVKEKTAPLDHAILPPQPDPSIVGYPISRFAPDRRSWDMVNTVRGIHQNHNPLGVSAEEWTARTELAAAYRGLQLLGLDKGEGLGSDQAAQCLMMRLPETDDDDDDDGNHNNDTKPITFLMADWGVWFEEVTASSLLKFTTDGDMIHPNGRRQEPGDPAMANTGCIPVAKAIFEARPDVQVIAHIHPYAVMAVGGTKVGLLPLSQAAFFLWGQVSREDYDFSYESKFESTLAQGFSRGERAMILNHHGMYAVGRDVAEAVFVATHLTQACEVQVRTLSMVGGDLSKVLLADGDLLSQQYRDMMDSTDYSYDGSREWPGFVRRVQRQAPDYNT